MQVFNGVLNSRKRGTYKRDLKSSSQDYIELDGGSYIQPVGSSVYFDIEVTDDTVEDILCSNGTVTDYISLNASNLLVVFNGGGGNRLGGQLSNGRHTLEVRRAPSETYFSVDGGAEEPLGSSNPFKFMQIGRRTGTYGDVNIYSLDVDSDITSFNESSGFNSTSTLGNTTTGNTSHADGIDYWNIEVIQRYV